MVVLACFRPILLPQTRSLFGGCRMRRTFAGGVSVPIERLFGGCGMARAHAGRICLHRSTRLLSFRLIPNTERVFGGCGTVNGFSEGPVFRKSPTCLPAFVPSYPQH